MDKIHLYDKILFPVVTEKSTNLSELNKITFKVPEGANKKNLKKNINFYLLYGPNNGLIEDSINDVLKPNFSKNIYNYDENEILSNTDNFNETIFNKSFFEKDKLIIISRETDKILNIKKDLLEKEFNGYVFERLKKSDDLYVYMIYIPELKISSRITTRFFFENYQQIKCKLFIILNEANIKRKIRISLNNE